MPFPFRRSLSGSSPHFKLIKIGLALAIVASILLQVPFAPFSRIQSKQESALDNDAKVSAALFRAYCIDGYRVDLKVLADGSAQVTESIDLFFNNDCDSITFNLALQGATALQFDSVAIANVNSAGEAASQIEVLPAASAQQAGNQTLSYTLNEAALNSENPATRLHVSAYIPAGSASRFIVNYTLRGGFQYVDQSVFIRRSFFQSLGQQVITEPILMISYPDGIAVADVWYQAISKASFLVAQVDAVTVQMSAIELDPNQQMEAVLVLPLANLQMSFAEQSEPSNINRAVFIQTIEKEAQKLKRHTQTRAFLISLIWILLLLAGLGYGLLYILFDREGQIQLRQTIKPQLQNVWRPAMLARLFRNHNPGQLLLGTLLDLVQRGKLKLDGHVFRQENGHAASLFQGLTAYEIFLLQWLFERVATTDSVSPAQIRKYALDHRTATEFSAYYEQFITLIQDELLAEKLIDSSKMIHGRRIGVSLASVYAILAAVFGILTLNWLSLILAVPSSLFLYYGLKWRHLTGEGNRQADIGRVFRKTLRHFSAHLTVEQATDLQLGEQLARLLPHAVALGVVRPFLSQTAHLTQQKPDQLQAFLRTFSQSLIATDPAQQLTDFQRDLEAMDSMLSASLYLALGFHFYE
ncbi:MAG: DUF2207 domain-containing protein [Eubacteriales bacterium]|nr:DUF2207 domain-containing protein [Eubacteriales bacterium]